MARDPSESYFQDYGPIQAHKHALIRHYLGAWYPKLSSWSGNVIYLETHAGRGVHEKGQAGSPLVAIRTLATHDRKDYLLNRCEFHFYLMEKEPTNASILRDAVAGEITHPKIKVYVEECDFSMRFKEMLDAVETRGQGIAPSFVFIDPFGYSIPIDLIQRILNYPSCEVMVNFMAQPVTRATRDSTKADNLNILFGSDVWRQSLGIEPFGCQMEKLIDLYQKAVGAKWTTKLRLTGQTDYTLLHFTNHPEGRTTMKKSVWAITNRYGKPGVNQLLVRDNPEQGILVTSEPDLSPLREAFQKDFFGKTITHQEAVDWLVDQDFLETHLHKVLAEGRRNGWIRTAHRRAFGPSMGNEPMSILGGSLL